MIKLILTNCKTNIKKYIAVITAVMAATLFILGAESIFSSYCEVKVSNAYSYSGRWDYRINYCESEPDNLPEGLEKIGYTENRYTAILDRIPEDEKYGIYAAFTDNYMFSIIGIDGDICEVTGDEPVEGRYPESPDELLVPDSYKYNGEYVKIGDEITLKLTERRDAGGHITQTEELSEDDIYTDLGEITYKVCGTYSTSTYTSGTYLFNAYTGKSDAAVRNYYYGYDNHTQSGFEDMEDLLKENYGQNAEGNSYVKISIASVYGSDYFKAISNGINVFRIIIIVVALAVIFLNLFQITESEKRKIRQLYTLGASKGQLAAVYGASLLAGELTGEITGILADIVLLTIGKNRLLHMLNSMYSDFSFVNINILELTVIYGVIAVATLIFVVLRIKETLRTLPKKKTDRTRKSVCHNLLELSYNNVRNRALFNAVMSVSLVMLMFMATLVISIHPGMVAKSEINMGMYAKHGHYSIISSKDIAAYEDELHSIDGINKITSYTGCNIDVDRYKDVSFFITAFDRTKYDEFRKINPDMVDYDTFSKGGITYILDDCISTSGNHIRNTDVTAGDVLRYSYCDKPETEYSIKIDGVISHPAIEMYVDHNYAIIFTTKENVLSGNPEYVDYGYYIFCNNDSIKQVGEALRVFSKKHDVGILDTAEVYELSEDNHSIQLFAVAVISGLFILIGVAGVITAVRLDRISRTGEFRIYRTLGMDRKLLRRMQFYEYMSVWLTAFILVLLMLTVGSYTILKDLIGYYDISFRNMLFNMFRISGVMIIIMYLIAMTAKEKGAAYRDQT